VYGLKVGQVLSLTIVRDQVLGGRSGGIFAINCNRKMGVIPKAGIYYFAEGSGRRAGKYNAEENCTIKINCYTLALVAF